MDKIGVLIKIDKLGRIVIPIEIRKRYNLNGEMELITTEDGVLIRNPEYVLTKRTK